MTMRLDHFTIGASSLEAGVAAMQKIMGVTMPQGGKHPLMSTHNCLMRTGEGQFMEMIAADPDAPSPPRTRWFSLDESRTMSRLAERPRALCWVVATDDIEATVKNSPIALGEIVTLSRDNLSWRLTVPKDGSLPEAGLIPAFIAWPDGPHPSTAQQDLGIRLHDIRITHPAPDMLIDIFDKLGIGHLATITKGPQALAFDVATPNGRLILD